MLAFFFLQASLIIKKEIVEKGAINSTTIANHPVYNNQFGMWIISDCTYREASISILFDGNIIIDLKPRVDETQQLSSVLSR